MTLDFWVAMIASSVTLTTPLIIAAMGENFSQQSGILNVGLEGFMLSGAMAGFAGTYYTGNPLIGFLCAILIGMALAAIHAFVSINIGASQFASGLGIYIFAFGITAFWYRVMLGDTVSKVMEINSLASYNIPLLSKIPIVGPIIFQHDPIVYAALLMVPLCHFIVYYTKLGLTIRAVGNNPLASESLGIKVYRIRYIGTLLSGAFGGLAGGYLTIQYIHIFISGITNGKGFVVLALLIVGNWNPLKILGAALIFGFIDTLQLRLPVLQLGVPFEFLMMLPYIITILILSMFRKVSMPRYLAVAYKKQK
jgi:simple sugar transport system permease protein